jgi:hypothetical protein
MDVVEDVHKCLAPFPPLFSYIVSTEEMISGRTAKNI